MQLGNGGRIRVVTCNISLIRFQTSSIGDMSEELGGQGKIQEPMPILESLVFVLGDW